MTTLTNKFQEVARQLQNLTIWRPNERDPLLELDRWRANAHLAVDLLYNKKRHDIDQLCEKHEREFLRQLARLRVSLNNVHQKLATKRETNARVRTFHENTIFNELQTIENDINTKLGRAEITIETIPFTCDGLVSIGLKTYLYSAPLMYSKQTPWKNAPEKSPRRSASEVKRAFDNWLQVKKEEELTRRETFSARRRERSAQDDHEFRQKARDEAFKNWSSKKREQGAFKKKAPPTDNHDGSGQEANETPQTSMVE